jgi:hypothetical protein
MGFAPTIVVPTTNSKRRNSNIAIFQQSRNNNINNEIIIPSVDKSIHSLLLGATVLASSSPMIPPSNAYSDIIVISSPPSVVDIAIQSKMPPIQTISPITSLTTTTSSSIHLTTTTTPMGELPKNTQINSTFSTFGQYFLLLYVVVSLLAGGKEVLGRIIMWLKKKDD